MNDMQDRAELYRPQEPAVTVPVSEVLRDPSRSAELWLDEGAPEASLVAQVEAHAERARAVTEVIDHLPDARMTIQTAIETDRISSTEASLFYDALSDTLADPDYRRLALYLPQAYIPKASWLPSDAGLVQSVERFRETYMSAWYDLLHVQDARANFVDGDVLEIAHRTGGVPRVVKAAHLTPQLLEAGLVDEAEVVRLRDAADSPVLRQSLAAGLAAYRGTPDIALMVTEPVADTVTERREAWLEQNRQQALIAAAAQQVTQAVLEGAERQTVAARAEEEALAEGIYGAVEETAAADIAQARAVYDRFTETFDSLWQEEAAADLQIRLASVFRRLYRLRIIDETALAARGIETPTLSGPWSENISLMTEAVEDIQRMSTELAVDPVLSELVYPVVLMGGSHLKGYAEPGSDIDIEIFVKPGVPETDRLRIQQLLEPIIGGRYPYELTEFWLNKDRDGQLQVRDLGVYDRHLADPYAAHILFGSAWVGDETVVADLQRELLTGYFYDDEADADSSPKRRLYLEKLEQDALQYRLMHKGYARHYPMTERPAWSRSSAIDGHSVFWDPGYRQLTTKLFINTVFLPKLKK